MLVAIPKKYYRKPSGQPVNIRTVSTVRVIKKGMADKVEDQVRISATPKLSLHQQIVKTREYFGISEENYG